MEFSERCKCVMIDRIQQQSPLFTFMTLKGNAFLSFFWQGRMWKDSMAVLREVQKSTDCVSWRDLCCLRYLD